MKLAAAVIVLTVGCHSATDRIAISTLGLVPITIGAADVATDKPGWAGFGDKWVGSLLLTTGIVWTGAWLIEATMAHGEPRHDEAHALDLEARAAVREGRCADVPAILTRARALDAGAPTDGRPAPWHDDNVRAVEFVSADPEVEPCIASLRRDEARERAWQLTKSAAAAARVDGCVTVRAIDPQVREADADFHDTVFARDAAIARCLAAQP